MNDLALHLLLVILSIVGGTLIERHKIWLLSRLLFWERRRGLIGTYTTVWHVEPGTVATPSAGLTAPAEAPVEDLVRIRWASGQYMTATASNSRYGDYTFAGTVKDSAITLTYCAKDKHLQDHIGVAMLRIEDERTLSGYWSQNRPDQAGVQRGRTLWRKRSDS